MNDRVSRLMLAGVLLGTSVVAMGCHRNTDGPAWTAYRPEDSATAFANLARDTTFWAHLATNGQDSTFPKDSTGRILRMQIVPQRTAHEFDYDANPPHGKAGRVLFRLINVGTETYEYPEVAPGDTAIVWATPKNSSRTVPKDSDSTRYEYVAYKLTSDPGKPLQLIESGDLVFCPHGLNSGEPSPYAHVDREHNANGCIGNPIPSRDSLHAETHGSWTQCGGGCCNVTGSKRRRGPGGPAN